MRRGDIKKKIVLLIIFVILILGNNVYALEESIKGEYTKEYLEWINLPEEERQKTLMPRLIEVNDNKLREKGKILIRPYSTLPVSYDLREHGLNISVKDQKQTGECWAFATMGSLESNLQLKRGVTVDLSERHLDYATSQSFTTANSKGFNREVNLGGNYYYSSAYLTNGMGAILESDMPFSESFGTKDISYIQGKTVVTKVEEYVQFPSVTTTSTTEKRTEAIKQVKEHLMNYGAVIVDVNSDNMNYGTEYYNDTYKAGYYDGNELYDHEVLIVGWDDNFSKTKFNSSHRPLADGAWIIKNSWGTQYGNGGYYYISYEDKWVLYNASAIKNSKYGTDYDNLYQHDELGATGLRTFETEKMYAANIFSNKTNKIETLTEISVRNFQDTYCKVYVNPTGTEKTKSNLVEATKEAKLCTPGYQTIKLDKPLAITGEEFAVIVEYYVPGGRATAAMEMRFEQEGYEAFNTITSNPGESYLSSNLNSVVWEDISTENENATIKAFTNNTPTLSVITIGTVLQTPNPTYDETGGKINIPVTTNSVADGAKLNVVIKKDGTDVTNKFTIAGNSINNNSATINITAPARTTKGNYQVEISYGSLAKQTANFRIEEYVPVTSISLDKTNIKLKKTETTTVYVAISPDNASNKKVTFTSDNPGVATVNEQGNVTAVSKGTAKIIAKTVDGNKTAECTVTVIDPKINYGELKYNVIGSGSQRAKVIIPVTAVDMEDNTNVSVLIKKENVDVSNKFTITGNTINNNSANIEIIVPMEIEIGMYTVELSDLVTGKKETKNFEIKNMEITITEQTQSQEILYNTSEGTISLHVSTYGIAEGENIIVKVLKENTDVTNKFIITADAINNGKTLIQVNANGIEAGIYKIQLSYSTQASAETTFEIKEYVPVERINLNYTNIELKKGETSNLEISVFPENATIKKINITNTKPSVATIDENGRITAISRGTTKITAKSEDGNKTAECTVTVIDPEINYGEMIYVSKLENMSMGELVMPIRGRITIPVISKDIKNGTHINVKIIKDETEDVTDKFLITGNEINYEVENIEIIVQLTIEKGKYKIELSDEVTNTKAIKEFEISEFEININNVQQSTEKMYNKTGGNITADISTFGINDGESLTVKVLKKAKESLSVKALETNSDVTSKFNIICPPINDSETTLQVQFGEINAGEYKVQLSYGESVIKEITFNVEEYIYVDSITINKNVINLKVGETEKINIKVGPDNAINKNVIIESSNTNVATVSQDGTITAKSKGESTIKIASEDGNVETDCKVIVAEATNNNEDDNNNNGNNNGNNNEDNNNGNNNGNNNEDNNGNNNNNQNNNNNGNNNNGNNSNDKNNNGNSKDNLASIKIPDTGFDMTLIYVAVAMIGSAIIIIYFASKKNIRNK